MTEHDNQRVYLAGPMRGIDAYNFPAFFEAEEVLREMGYRFIFNPARADVIRTRKALASVAPDIVETTPIDPQKWGEYLLKHPEQFNLREALAEDLKFITEQADLIVLLPGYETSSGVKAERAVAEALGIEILVLDRQANGDRVLVPIDLIETPWPVEDPGVSMEGTSGPTPEEQVNPFLEMAKRLGALAGNPVEMEVNTTGFDTVSQSGEVRSVSSSGGEKGVKPERYDLIPWEAMDEVARVYAFGATKYADHNWRKGYEWGKSISSLIRHTVAFIRGERVDPESGLHPLAHAVFHCLALITWGQEPDKTQYDDRYKRPEEQA